MAWGWVPSPSWGGSALDLIPGSWVAVGFLRTWGQILTVLLLPAPGEQQAFLLKGPSGAELFGRWLLCRLQLQPSLQFWNRFLQLEALMGVGSCMLPALEQPDQGGGVLRADEPPAPHTVTAPSCSPSVGWACGGLVRAEGSDVMCAACLPPWVSPGRRLQTSAAWGKPPRVYVKQVVSP